MLRAHPFKAPSRPGCLRGRGDIQAYPGRFPLPAGITPARTSQPMLGLGPAEATTPQSRLRCQLPHLRAFSTLSSQRTTDTAHPHRGREVGDTPVPQAPPGGAPAGRSPGPHPRCLFPLLPAVWILFAVNSHSCDHNHVPIPVDLPPGPRAHSACQIPSPLSFHPSMCSILLSITLAMFD